MKRLTLLLTLLLVGVALLGFSGGRKEEAEKAKPAAAAKGKYQEAPVLAQMVMEGLTPPVEERLPDNPLVVKPLHSIGTYGGTARVINLRSPVTR